MPEVIKLLRVNGLFWNIFQFQFDFVRNKAENGTFVGWFQSQSCSCFYCVPLLLQIPHHFLLHSKLLDVLVSRLLFHENFRQFSAVTWLTVIYPKIPEILVNRQTCCNFLNIASVIYPKWKAFPLPQPKIPRATHQELFFMWDAPYPEVPIDLSEFRMQAELFAELGRAFVMEIGLELHLHHKESGFCGRLNSELLSASFPIGVVWVLCWRK